jgi:malonyl-CoA O-methyltransferase
MESNILGTSLIKDNYKDNLLESYMSTERPPTISPNAVAHWLRTAPGSSPWLHEEVASRMVERLQWIRLQPKAWAHWGVVRGGKHAHDALLDKYPDAAYFLPLAGELIADTAIKNIVKNSKNPKWNIVKAFQKRVNPEVSTLEDGAVDMLWANMQLHNALDPQALISQWHKALAIDGFLMFSCLGPDTLRELRGMYDALGWPFPCHQFTDMHDWGDMLVQAGFAEPVMDMERIVLTYETPQKLLEDLRELGRNLHPDRFPALRGKAWKAKLEAALVEHLANPAEGGRLKLTFEVIYGHAMKPKPRIKLSEQSSVSLQDMRAMLQGSRER